MWPAGSLSTFAAPLSRWALAQVERQSGLLCTTFPLPALNSEASLTASVSPCHGTSLKILHDFAALDARAGERRMRSRSRLEGRHPGVEEILPLVILDVTSIPVAGAHRRGERSCFSEVESPIIVSMVHSLNSSPSSDKSGTCKPHLDTWCYAKN